MKRLFWILFASGCATMPVSLKPLAAHQAVQASEYQLVVDGQAGSRVLFTEGKIVDRTVEIGALVENKSDQPFRLDIHQASPSQIVTEPGQTQRATLRFQLPPDAKADVLSGVTVRWNLKIGPAMPVERTTTFVAQRGRHGPFEVIGPSETFAGIGATGFTENKPAAARRVYF
jgi:hypothetical protein